MISTPCKYCNGTGEDGLLAACSFCGGTGVSDPPASAPSAPPAAPPKPTPWMDPDHAFGPPAAPESGTPRCSACGTTDDAPRPLNGTTLCLRCAPAPLATGGDPMEEFEGLVVLDGASYTQGFADGRADRNASDSDPNAQAADRARAALLAWARRATEEIRDLRMDVSIRDGALDDQTRRTAAAREEGRRQGAALAYQERGLTVDAADAKARWVIEQERTGRTDPVYLWEQDRVRSLASRVSEAPEEPK